MAAPDAVVRVARDSAEHDDTDDRLVTGEAVALDVAPTPYVLRAAGAIIDLLLAGGLAFGSVYLIQWLAAGGGLDDAALQAFSLVGIVLSLVVLPIAVETATRGRSLGKLAVGARIVRDDGGSISFRHALVRGLTGMLELVMTIGGLAAVVGLVSARSRRLGDLLAGTHSQLERVPAPRPIELAVPAELLGWSRTADVARMPERLSRRVAQFLAQASGMTPASRQRLAGELAREVSLRVSPVPAVHPETFLLAVAAIRREREATALALRGRRRDALAPVLEALPHGFPRR
ncbi:RDD family protein [Microbacteriaceae bacterium VKM Ac-2854]|nr:RDD family protein [Microbacteriaceae bacterium VKM Ac-2854]